jgi:hypothetical protein
MKSAIDMPDFVSWIDQARAGRFGYAVFRRENHPSGGKIIASKERVRA